MATVDRCRACGGASLVDAVDNDGQPYKGCARCTLRLTPRTDAGVSYDHCPECRAVVPTRRSVALAGWLVQYQKCMTHEKWCSLYLVTRDERNRRNAHG